MTDTTRQPDRRGERVGWAFMCFLWAALLGLQLATPDRDFSDYVGPLGMLAFSASFLVVPGLRWRNASRRAQLAAAALIAATLVLMSMSVWFYFTAPGRPGPVAAVVVITVATVAIVATFLWEFRKTR